MRTGTRLLSLCIVCAAAGCANEPTQSKSNAELGWRKTQVALANAGVGEGWNATGHVDEGSVSGIAMGTVACPDGGSLEVTASGEVTDAQVRGQVRIDFHACTVDDLTIDGTLDYEGSVQEHRVVAEYHGDLQWSGALSGTCAVDLSAEVTTDAAHANVNVSGNLCGHDWSDL